MGAFDFLFIDGGHRYDEVAADFRNFSPLVHSGGVIAMHDVMVREHPDCDVWRVWDEITGDKIILWDGEPSPGIGACITWDDEA